MLAKAAPSLTAWQWVSSESPSAFIRLFRLSHTVFDQLNALFDVLLWPSRPVAHRGDDGIKGFLHRTRPQLSSVTVVTPIHISRPVHSTDETLRPHLTLLYLSELGSFCRHDI
ncbi:hypothetical protein K474DRAFT_1670767 [Panus rudis PR-1116 ss-1]|nr:hypothetical protein K474DRAFT_1670776 [Panus rudis PR-1116 ss-1]KAI0069607.1 hypothetical protein K474DRAFT_1670767 [Panus rudis PR-1116 ss-1]